MSPNAVEMLQKLLEVQRKVQSQAAGPVETPLASWKYQDVHFGKMPDDPHGALRVSIGGLPVVPGDPAYCRYRGDKQACIKLLERVLVAMRAGSEVVADGEKTEGG
jgi:hypothetical protein